MAATSAFALPADPKSPNMEAVGTQLAAADRGMHKEAVTYAREAIEVEPTMSDPYFTLSQSLVVLEQFDEAIGIYKTLQDDFGYEFSRDNFAEDATFKKFIASPQFRKWLRN